MTKSTGTILVTRSIICSAYFTKITLIEEFVLRLMFEKKGITRIDILGGKILGVRPWQIFLLLDYPEIIFMCLKKETQKHVRM